MMRTFFKSANFELLCQSIAAGDSNEVIQRAVEIISTNNIHWDELYDHADINAVKPQLGRLLNNLPPQLVPQSIIKKLDVANRENLYLQLQYVSEYFQIKKLLDEAGITAIPFKGFWFANEFYGNLADRESVDVDLFIKAADLEKVKAVMFGRNYIAEEPLPQLTAEYILNELCEYNFDQFRGEIRLFHFEFHWRISLNVYGLNINFEELEAQITTGNLQHTELKVFNPSANLLLAVMHHAGKDQLLQLKQVWDITSILKKQPGIDWDWVICKAEKYHMENMLFVSIKVAALLTGVNIPGEIRDKVNTKFILGLALNRVKLIAGKRNREKNIMRDLNNIYFQFRSRRNAAFRFKFLVFEFRTRLLTKLIPKKFHRIFYKKNTRIKAVN